MVGVSGGVLRQAGVWGGLEAGVRVCVYVCVCDGGGGGACPLGPTCACVMGRGGWEEGGAAARQGRAGHGFGESAGRGFGVEGRGRWGSDIMQGRETIS